MIKLSREAIRAIRENHNACGYVYPDGVLIRADKKIVQAKRRAMVERWFAFPGDTKLSGCRYRPSGMQESVKIDRVVCHDPLVLLDGLTSMEVAYSDGSSRSREMKL